MSYTKEEIEKTFKRVIKEISTKGHSLRQVLRNKDMPSSQTFYKWLKDDEIKSKQYARACYDRADKIFDEIIELADATDSASYMDKNGNPRTDWGKVQRNRLQIDARKWSLSKMMPKKYGDKLDLTTEGEKIKISFKD